MGKNDNFTQFHKVLAHFGQMLFQIMMEYFMILAEGAGVHTKYFDAVHTLHLKNKDFAMFLTSS